jgi:hypothetical protein
MAITIPCTVTHVPYTFTDIDRLKPCPFCGCTDKLAITDKDNFIKNYAENGSATIRLECERCHLDFHEHDYEGDNYDIKAQTLMIKWNNRKES